MFELKSHKCDILWCDKYKPTSIDDLCGNKQSLKKINQWMNDFKQKIEGTKPGLFISGPPGIGKTTIAHLILDTFGYEVIEYNASDVRSQKSVKENLNKVINSINISIMQHNQIKYIGIIMDEVDGMSSGDRGGVAELVSIINPNKGKRKSNKIKIEYINPIICISNNNTDKKLADLRKNCLEITFNKPTSNELLIFAKKIITSEGIQIDDISLNLIINHAQGDFRRIGHILQDINNTCLGDVSMDDIENINRIFIKKNIELSLFDATNKILSEYKDIKSSLNMYESDRSLVSMMVHENVTNRIIKLKNHDDDKFVNIYNIYHYMSLGDIIDKHIYNNQCWNLQDFNGIIKCTFPSFVINRMKKNNYLKDPVIFTSILSKSAIQFSNFKCITHLKNKLNIDKTYLPYYSDIILDNIFMNKDNKKIDKTINLLKEYNLTVCDIERLIKVSKINQTIDYKKLLTNKAKNHLFNNYSIDLGD